MTFNPPPGWPTPPPGWSPPAGWKPDPSWPEPPPGWQLWISDPQDTAQPSKNDAAIAEGSPGIAQFAPTPPREDAEQLPDPAVDPTPIEPREPAEIAALRARIVELQAALDAARTGGGDLVDLNDQRVLQDVGIYRYHHPLEDAAAYKERLGQLESRIDEVVKSGRAVLAADMFTFGGSLAKGRKMVGDLSKLMLRAYNAEADNCVRSLRAGNVSAAKKRLGNAVKAIERLGVIMEMRINPAYHDLRVAELELTADYQMKRQEERERAREERELLREQRRVEQELAAERERLEKERTHYVTVLESLRATGDNTAADELATRLAEIDQAIETNDYRIANIRAGYVYVISNVGAFGPNVVKIGMTRRLEPRDRIRELGDASVPFTFDVHALFFSDDAVTLENELQKEFANRRMNWINPRKEFFFATPQDVRVVLAEKVGGLLEYNNTPEALDYFQSRSSWPHFD